MYVVWKCECDDGNISQISSKETRSLPCSICDKPHELAKCSFQILSLHVTEDFVEIIPSYYLDILNKCSEPQPIVITTTIGYSCTTEFDRLLDICLSKMGKAEVAKFEIECLKVKVKVDVVLKVLDFENFKELYEMTPEELIDSASELKSHGVTLYSNHRIPDAFHKFSKSVKLLMLIEEQNEGNTIIETKQKLMNTLFGNLAGCHVAHKNWESAIDLCNSVLGNDPQNVKALFRRGASLLEIQEFDRARHDLLAVKELEPGNLTIKSKLILLDDKEKEWKHKSSSAMKKMFRP